MPYLGIGPEWHVLKVGALIVKIATWHVSLLQEWTCAEYEFSQ